MLQIQAVRAQLEHELEKLLEIESSIRPPVSPSPSPRSARRLTGRHRRFLGGAGAHPARLGQALHRGARRQQPAVLQVVRRRQAQRLLQLPRPPRRGRPRRPRRVPLARRGGRAAGGHVCRAARDVQKLANGLKSLGVEPEDVVGIYLPMIPEVVVAMLACARIGAVHNVVFGGFSVGSVTERMEVSEAKVLITVDGARRKGKTAPIKSAVDAEIGAVKSLQHIVVVRAPAPNARCRRAATSGTTSSASRRSGVPAGPAVGRAPALHPVFVRLDREAQGHPAHHRRLPDRRRLQPSAGLRPRSRTPTSTGARPTSAGSPATATSSTARLATAPPP